MQHGARLSWKILEWMSAIKKADNALKALCTYAVVRNPNVGHVRGVAWTHVFPSAFSVSCFLCTTEGENGWTAYKVLKARLLSTV